ncbi:MAG: hypothetical protein Q9165_004402 [Trypethelium subeluteriae]
MLHATVDVLAAVRIIMQGRGDFTFRSARQGPKFDVPPGPPGSSRPDGPRRKGPFSGTNPNNQGRRQGGHWGRRPFTRTHDRPLLTAKREVTPERLAGMSDGLARFKTLENISQSEESMAEDSDENDGASDIEPQRKKVARGNDEPSRDSGNSVPKWSNPDPYTALPPPDESKGKKTDVVKMIRKARIVQEKTDSVKPSVAEDFISFNFDKDDGQVSEATDTEDQENGGVPIRPPTTGDLSFAPSVKDLPRWNMDPTAYVPKIALSSVSRYSLDEVIKPRESEQPPGQPSKKRKRVAGLDGSLLTDWMAKDAMTAKPWCVVDRSGTEDVSQWLHDEIRDFYDYVKPRPFEAEMREDLIKRVSQVFHEHDAMVDCFGSFAIGMYLPTGDMDLVALSRRYLARGQRAIGQSLGHLQSFAFELEEADVMQKRSKEVIWKAKVPLVKYVDKPTRLRVDISFENVTGIRAIETLKSWGSEFPAMPVIVCVIKQFLLMRGLNEMYTGGMNSFTIICLVVSLLQHHPTLRSGNLSPHGDLGDILLQFFDYYGNKFDTSTTEIHLRPAKYAHKRVIHKEKADRLSVIDPNNAQNDISGGTKLIKLILNVFSEAHQTLVQRMTELDEQTVDERKGRSILGSIVGGNYTSYERQREHLRVLASKLRK